MKKVSEKEIGELEKEREEDFMEDVKNLSKKYGYKMLSIRYKPIKKKLSIPPNPKGLGILEEIL